MSMLGVDAAAERLGVSTRQVQHLIAQGDVRKIARGVVDAASVDRLLMVRGESHHRAWSGATAWGAVGLLAGNGAPWMGESQRSRLRSRLRQSDATELVAQARERARVTRYRAHASTGRHLRAEMVLPSDTAGGLGLTGSAALDGYVAADQVDQIVARHGLIRDDNGHVTLRATTMDLNVVRELAQRGVVLGALDLGESLDVRERRAGLDALERVLEIFRG